jgi:hypothetical protein
MAAAAAAGAAIAAYLGGAFVGAPVPNVAAQRKAATVRRFVSGRDAERWAVVWGARAREPARLWTRARARARADAGPC